MAERPGFEPGVPSGTTVFETAPINHSGTSPIISKKAQRFFRRRLTRLRRARPPRFRHRTDQPQAENHSGTSPVIWPVVQVYSSGTAFLVRSSKISLFFFPMSYPRILRNIPDLKVFDPWSIVPYPCCAPESSSQDGRCGQYTGGRHVRFSIHMCNTFGSRYQHSNTVG